MLEINSYEEFAAHLGEEIGTSEWLTVDQDRINPGDRSGTGNNRYHRLVHMFVAKGLPRDDLATQLHLPEQSRDGCVRV